MTGGPALERVSHWGVRGLLAVNIQTLQVTTRVQHMAATTDARVILYSIPQGYNVYNRRERRAAYRDRCAQAAGRRAAPSLRPRASVAAQLVASFCYPSSCARASPRVARCSQLFWVSDAESARDFAVQKAGVAGSAPVFGARRPAQAHAGNASFSAAAAGRVLMEC